MIKNNNNKHMKPLNTYDNINKTIYKKYYELNAQKKLLKVSVNNNDNINIKNNNNNNNYTEIKKTNKYDKNIIFNKKISQRNIFKNSSFIQRI